MKRKQFLRSLAVSGSGLATLPAMVAAIPNEFSQAILPAYLKPGDTIAISSPAGYITEAEVMPARLKLQEWGFKVRLGYTVGRRDFSFGGTDEERLKDFQILMDDPGVKAILCARGGYGITRIIDRLTFTRFKEKPKWVIGFSDISAFHIHILKHHNIAAVHSKMCNSFPEDWNIAEPVVQESLLSLKQLLTGTKMVYKTPPLPYNRKGIANGQLIGGNLSIIQHLMGTASEINTENKILFLEEVGEYLYSLDRMMVNLKRAKKLDRLAGLIIGGFNRIKPDDINEEFGRTVEEIIMDKVSAWKYPVCFGFPVGHQKHNVALKNGALHTLTVRDDTVELTEMNS